MLVLVHWLMLLPLCLEFLCWVRPNLWTFKFGSLNVDSADIFGPFITDPMGCFPF